MILRILRATSLSKVMQGIAKARSNLAHKQPSAYRTLGRKLYLYYLLKN